MLGFACIRDCSVCPFSCNRQFTVGIPTRSNVSNELPQGLSNPVVENTTNISDEKTQKNTEIQTNFAEKLQKNDEKSENLPVLSENSSEIETKETQNLPILSDIQYHVETIGKKKGLFGWRKDK